MVLVITCFAFVSEATSDPPDQEYGIETMIYQNSNSDGLTVNLYANLESNRYGASLKESQFCSLNNEVIKAESNPIAFVDYCYISRHRRTKSLNNWSYIQNTRRCKNDKRDPLIRGHDKF